MSYKTKHLSNIISANNDNRLALFVGAGISKSAETASAKIPIWKDLIDDIKAELELKEVETDFLKIAQLYFLEFGPHTYYEKLKSYFDINLEPSLVHKLIFDINPHCIITTNWDTLLEKAIEKNSFIYETVASDKDLVKSTISKKLIKMHGDFQNHNIVFKEDDYLSYKSNFPIIENFIRSILSTHTVLFLGYSYNDINLKHIMKWLLNHSHESPPKYLLVHSSNPTQAAYLQNHSIDVIELDLKVSDKFKALDEYASRTATFLDLIANPNQIYLGADEDSIINYVYQKLRHLDHLDSILIEQITRTLTNSRAIYPEEGLVILEFLSTVLSRDYDAGQRKLYARFVEVLKKYDDKGYKKKKVERVLKIFAKANINGILLDEKQNGNIEYLAISNFDIPADMHSPTSFLEKLLNFNYVVESGNSTSIGQLAELAFLRFQKKEYEACLQSLDEVILLCLAQKNYAQLFIAMFNVNVVVWRTAIFAHQGREGSSRKEYDLTEKYNSLPKDLQNSLAPLISFLSFDYIYKFAFKLTKEYQRKESAAKAIESGSFVYNSDISEVSSLHKNLLTFILSNKIMIEDYTEFKSIISHIVSISLIRQYQSEVITLNKIEIYSAIKYIPLKELEVLFEIFTPGRDPDGKNKRIFSISTEDKAWLIENVLANTGKIYFENKRRLSDSETPLLNTIFLLSLVELQEAEVNEVMGMFFNILSEANCTIPFYQAINSFLGAQYRLYETKISNEDLIRLIEAIIFKLSYRKYSGFDYHAVTSNTINNLYGYALNSDVKYENFSLVKRLLFEIEKLPAKEKMNISKAFLMNVYDISSTDIQNLIKEFVLAIEYQDQKLEEAAIFGLTLVARKFVQLDKSILEMVDKMIEKYSDGKSFASYLYTAKHLLTYIQDNMEVDLEKQLIELAKIISNFESRKQQSLI